MDTPHLLLWNMATIIREKEAHGDSTYLLRIKYGHVDAKKALQDYVQRNKGLAKSPKMEGEYVQIFCDNMLSFLPERNAQPLAKWLFGVSVRNGYICEVPQIWAVNNKEYIISSEVLK